MPRARLAFFALLLLTVFALGAQCGGQAPPPQIIVTTPVSGTFTTAPTIAVSGRVTRVDPVTSVFTVNGVVVPLNPDRTWSAVVTLDPVAIINPIIFELDSTSWVTLRSRVTVIASDFVNDGDFSLESMALRITAAGLDAMEPVIGSLFVFDPSMLVPVGSVLADECFIDGGFFCAGSARVTVQNPPPTISGFGVDAVPITDAISGVVSINDLRIDLFIDGSGLVPNCGLRLTATTTDIPGTYAVEPDPVNPNGVDVQQTSVGVSFTGFDQEFTSGLCDVIIIGDIIQLIIGDLEPLVTQGFVDFLSDPDGAGPVDAPIADGIELAVSGLDVSGDIGSQIGVSLEAPHFALDEDPTGLTVGTDARITASLPDPAAEDLPASYHVTEPFPAFSGTTPGGAPYDIGLCIATSAFNQLLKAEIESGLLISSLTELDLGPPVGLVPITAGFLAGLVPEFGLLDPATPIRVDIRPTMAPFVTGNDGPGGEIGEMRVPHLQVDLVDTASGALLLQLAVDATVGLDIGFANGELAITVGTLDTQSLRIDILQNTLASNELVLNAVLNLFLPVLFPSLADSLGGFPLPDFFGLQTALIEVDKNGDFMSLFLDLF